MPGSFQEKTRIQGQKQDHLQPEEERVRPNDPEAVGFGEISAQEPAVAVNNFEISSPISRNVTPTQIDHNAVTPESNLNSDSLWLQMSQYLEQTQKQFAELEASHERMKILTASMDKIVKNLQEGHAQLSRASEETNKRLNLVFEVQHHRTRDRHYLDRDINKLFNVYHNMKAQPQGHVVDNPYCQEDIKPYFMFVNKARSPPKYQDNMSYSKKESLKQLPEASIWPKSSGTGEYDHMALTFHIDGLFIDVPRIPVYSITARLNTAFKEHASIWYTEMKEIHGGRVKSSKTTAMVPGYGKRPCHLKITNNLWRKIHMSDKPRGRVAEVAKKKTSCHNYGSTDHYANNCPKTKKKVYAIEKVPEEESPTEDSDSDSMGDTIREQSYEDQDPREEFLVEYQEETPLEIQGIQLEAGMPQDTSNRNLCKHTQDAQTFLV
ncbi:hypothetical protein O181_039343 [Austropuccinia psidii MF-1]|uniref:Uncharacterized protein n=1 Tax=Austropuccinia psidii MF-1 TaxID=1389203 RepID=A0A9Q3HBW7_9BASI|nr:hypothetical protein [Austropuccinia psidii MF-1]